MKQSYRRSRILEGKLDLPEQIVELVGSKYREEMDALFQSLWINYVKNKGKLSIPAWMDRFKYQEIFNAFTMHLSRSGWITTVVIPARNWGELYLNEEKLLQFVTIDELIKVRERYKFQHYKLNMNPEITGSDLTKIGNRKRFTGIKRPGFAHAANSKFKYDIPMLERYKDVIELNLTKSMDKLHLKYESFHDNVDYSSVSKNILEYHTYNSDAEFTTGKNINDSRGRAISDSLRKVFNPISNKDARALLITPGMKFNDSGLEAVYLFIAELLGKKANTFKEKANAGRRAYYNREIHDMKYLAELNDNMTAEEIIEEEKRAEEARKDLHEEIWLERIYAELDAYNESKTIKNSIHTRILYRRIKNNRNTIAEYRARGGEWHISRIPGLQESIDNALKDLKEQVISEDFMWTVPIELDATASMLQIEGALLNHLPFLDRTNCCGEILKDIWTFPGIPRNQFKKAMTPILYGSSKQCNHLWKNAKIKYTRKQVVAFEKEVSIGEMAVANEFQKFLINESNPEVNMTLHSMDEFYEVECNRYTNEGDYQVKYMAYDTESDGPLTIYHTHTKRVPDLQQFKRFFPTGLIHNLDSQVANQVCLALLWVISIHDAFLVNPMEANKTRAEYCKMINKIYARREEILMNYFKSIGIDSSSATAWKRVTDKVIPADGFVCQPSALK
jgi:hypothetical protein